MVMFQRKPSHFWLKIVLMICAFGFLLFLVTKNTACPFRKLTGVPCPGCGMSRAWLAVLHGNFKEAFHYHPLFWIIPVLMIFILWDGQIFSSQKANSLFAVGLAAAVGICWIIRLIMYFGGNLAI